MYQPYNTKKPFSSTSSLNKFALQFGTPTHQETGRIPSLKNTTGVPSTKNTTGAPSTLFYKNGQWTNAANLGGNSFYFQKMNHGWNPFKTGVPWTQKTSIGSDASRQGSYLGGITHSAPQMSYMGTYQDKALTDKPYGSAGYKAGINQNYRKMPYFL